MVVIIATLSFRAEVPGATAGWRLILRPLGNGLISLLPIFFGGIVRNRNAYPFLTVPNPDAVVVIRGVVEVCKEVDHSFCFYD